MIEIQAYTSKVIIPIPIEVDFTFNGGEEHIKLCTSAINNRVKKVVFNVSLQNSSDIFKLLLAKNAMDTMFKGEIILKLGYMPYARQDRVCNSGEALSVKVMADIINTMNFSEVTILDPHSDVTPALLNNVVIRDQSSLLGQAYLLNDSIMKENTIMVAPDAGATKKVQAIADVYKVDFIQGYKTRDKETGALSGFGFIGDVTDKKLIIMDDICDGGGTFIGLAKKLLENGGNAKSVSLFISHGIFSKGINILLENGISHIYTSNSVLNTNYMNEIHSAVMNKTLTVLPWS